RVYIRCAGGGTSLTLEWSSLGELDESRSHAWRDARSIEYDSGGGAACDRRPKVSGAFGWTRGAGPVVRGRPAVAQAHAESLAARFSDRHRDRQAGSRLRGESHRQLYRADRDRPERESAARRVLRSGA